MDYIRIQGGVALQGNVCIQGSKNAALPILAATLLTEGSTLLKNCPRISDVYAMVSLLQNLGCIVRWQDNGIEIDTSLVRTGEMKSEDVTGMRSSLCLLGAMLGRCSEVVMEYPGGCCIGARPIDMHIAALQKMGVRFSDENGKLLAAAEELHGEEIVLPKPSVGATENVILAAIGAEGDTILEGAAREPEVVALCRYLESCGAQIDGAGTERLVIRGGRKLWGTEYIIPADRIVAGTYLLAAVGTGGEVFLEKAPWEELGAVLEVAGRMGGQFCPAKQGLFIQGPKRLASPGEIETAPYPGFPTDLQSMALAVATLCEGETVIKENLFENRFRIVDELNRMGASVSQVDADCVQVRGVAELLGRDVEAKELRGGAALVLAGLLAKGNTGVSGCPYIYRGYENICRDFRELGARIISV